MATNLLGLAGYIQQQGDVGRERGKKTRLADLMGQAFQAPREQRQPIFGQMAQVDPQSAFDAEKGFRAMDDNARAQLGQSLAAFDTLPDEQKAQAYPQIAQQARSMLGLPVPLEWNPAMAPNIQKLAQVLGSAGQGGSVQSRFVGDDGQVYALMRDGSVQGLGIKADPKTQIMEAAGGIFGIDKRTFQASPVQVGAPGRGGEVPFSIDPSLPPEIQADIRRSEAQGQPWTQAPQGGYQLQAAPPKVSPVQMAQLGLSQQAAQRDAERLRLAQEAAARSASKGSVADQKAVAEARKKMPQLQNAVRGIDRIQQALQGLSGGMVNTGPLDQYAQRFTKEGQELEAAVGAIQNSVLALTRVPGVGSQSDLEQRVAMLQYPSLDKAPEVNARTMQNLRLFLQDLQDAYQNVLGEQQDVPQSNAIPVNNTSDDDLIGKYL